MPTLSDFHKILSTKENSKELSEILTGFLKGKSLGMFDCVSNINVDEHYIDFDLSSITDEITKVLFKFGNYNMDYRKDI